MHQALDSTAIRPSPATWAWAAALIFAAATIGTAAAWYPDTLQEITSAVFWAPVLSVVVYYSVRRSLDDTWHRRLVLAALLLRVPLVAVHLAVGFWVLKGLADFPGYFYHGIRFGEALLQGDIEFFIYWGAENVNFTQLGSYIVKRLLGFVYLFVGASWPGMFFVSGILGFLGAYLFLRAFQSEFPSRRDSRFLVPALFFFPSMAFWTSLLGKDSWMFFFLGLATYTIARMLREPRLRYGVGLITAVGLTVLIRPAIGVLLLIAVGGAAVLIVIRWRATGPAAILRPVAVMTFGLVAVLGTAIAVIPTVRLYGQGIATSESVLEVMLEVAVSKHLGLSSDPFAGGSSMAVSVTEPTVSASLRYLPIGMFTFLFRPLVFEAHNTAALVAAADATLLLLLVLVRWRHLVASARAVAGRPFVAFCVAMFLMATAGLSFESNFGAIVRHRSMVLPFLFILLAVPRDQRDAASARTAG